MLALIAALKEPFLGLGLFVAGCFLFVLGNRLFGRRTGGKRLVVFVAALAFGVLAYFLLKDASSNTKSSVALVILGAGCLLVGAVLLFCAVASEEKVEAAFKFLLRSY